MAGVIDTIKFKELRDATIALNDSGLLKGKGPIPGILEKDLSEEGKLKLVGVTKEVILSNFMKAIEAIPDEDGKFPGPKVALDFFNTVVEMEEKAAKVEQKETEKKEKPAKTPKEKKEKTPKEPKPPKEKKEKPAKEPKAPKEKKEKEQKGPGIISTILETIKNEGPVDMKTIHERLVKAFPDRDADKIMVTVRTQLGGKKHPLRIEKDKGIEVDNTDGKFSIK